MIKLKQKSKNSFLIISLLFATNIFCQSINWKALETNPQINDPKVSGLNLAINDDSVNLSTGKIMPSIPLSTISCSKLNDQVNLVYTGGSGIKVNDIASDVGLGWELNVGGFISREVRGLPDERTIWVDAAPSQEGTIPVPQINGQKSSNGWLDYVDWTIDPNSVFAGQLIYVPKTPQSNKRLAKAIQEFGNSVSSGTIPEDIRSLGYLFFSGSNDPVNPANLVADLASMSGFGYDIFNTDGEPDLFYYQFGNHSGKFVLDGEGNAVAIPFNPRIKIVPPFGPNASGTDNWIITIDDGTQYLFPNDGQGYYTEKMRAETEASPYTDDWRGPTPDRDESISVSEYTSKWNLSQVNNTDGESLTYFYDYIPDLEYTIESDVQLDFHEPTTYEGAYGLTPPPHFPSSGDDSFTSKIRSRDTDYKVKRPRISKVISSCGNEIRITYAGPLRVDLKNPYNALSSIQLYDYNNKLVEGYNFGSSFFSSTGGLDYLTKRLRLDNMIKYGVNNTNTIPFTFHYRENSIPLPMRNSPKQDFWGYFNDNITDNLIPFINYKSKYNRSLPGANRRPHAIKSKKYILKRIDYPTAGFVQYDYEQNTYNSNYETTNNVVTGGLRIKNIAYYDDDNSLLKLKQYDYSLISDNTKSSGQIPQHLRQWSNYGSGRLFDKQFLQTYFGTSSGVSGAYLEYIYVARYSNLKYLQANDLIRYSNVTITSDTEGSTSYKLTSFDTNPDIEKIRHFWVPYDYFDWVVDPTEFYTYSESAAIPLGRRQPSSTVNLSDKSYERGLILSEELFDSTGKLTYEKTNTYNFSPENFIPKKVYGLGVDTDSHFFIENQEIHNLTFELYSHISDFFYLENSIEKTYDRQGDNFIETSSNFKHENSDHILLTNHETFDSNGKIYKSIFKYPQDIVNKSAAEQSLINQNKVSTLINQITSVTNNNVEQILSSKYFEYDNFNTDQVLLKRVKTAKSDDTLEDRTIINLYDERGNVVELQRQEGPPITFIWGYNKLYPIAKIEGATYREVDDWLDANYSQHIPYLQDLSDQDVDDSSEDTLRLWLNNLRLAAKNEGSEAFITTYTYDPLIGVTSTTDPRGQTVYYEYDSFNRLKYVKDKDGNILSENEYNYKN